MIDKYLSIITNFGCHYTCPYCIVKENNLHIPKTTINGLNNVGKFVKEYNCNWISISGGGDPLYNFNQNKDWYDKLFYLNQGQNKMELHTSYILNDNIYIMFDRVVYHIRNIDDIKRIEKYGKQLVRVVFVVDDSFTLNVIKYSPVLYTITNVLFSMVINDGNKFEPFITFLNFLKS